MVPLLFFCSGATALIYEVVWSKYLSLMFGSTVQAQTVVLAVFMGGLALGNSLFGHRADKARQPLALYGYLEVAIGLYAFFFNGIYRLADAAFVGIGSGFLDQRALLLAFKGALSVVLLLGPTLLMGGTLPVLASWLQRQSNDAGRWSARFYSINSLGAVLGSGLAGFYLVRNLGLVSALQMTALVNVLIGFTAIGLSRYRGESEPVASPVAAEPKGEARPATAKWVRSGYALVALTGAVSMGLEVLASRSLVMIFGASLQAFAIVLMAFILGIGLGSAAVASPRLRRIPMETGTVVLLLAAASLVGLLVLGIEQWARVYAGARSGLSANTVGFHYHQLLTGGMSLIVIGIPAGLLGAVLPMWIRAYGSEGAALGGQVGRLLTWNTIGAVFGVLATGFILMPRAGLRGSFMILVVVLCVAAVLTAWANRRRGVAVFAAGLAVVLVLASLNTGAGWRHVLSSGVFRMRSAENFDKLMELRRNHVKILFYEDAPDATVSVEQADGIAAPDDVGLRINGKVDASSRVDLATQYLIAHLPMIARPASKDVFVLGLGSGVTAGALLGHPVEQIVVAENCEPVIRAAHFFAPWNRGAWTNALVKLKYEDARTVLKLSPQLYDIIICEPSNPWTIGVGSVFSREFYELTARRLKEGGIMTQWFHVYEMSDNIVGLVLRTFASVFPYVEIWDPGSADIILMGSKRPWASSLEVYHRIFLQPVPRKDMEDIGLHTAASLWARQLASQGTAFAIPGNGPIQSDYFPILEYEAPKAFYIGTPSLLLLQYDERTWQLEMAPPEKNLQLASLDDQELMANFGHYASVNAQINNYFSHRYADTNFFFRPATTVDVDSINCIFRRTNALPRRLKAPHNASSDFKRLLEAEALMHDDPAQWQAGVEAIIAILRNFKARGGAPFPDWSPTHFSAVAARASLRRNDRLKAGEALVSGLQIEPHSGELLYLARILKSQ